MPLSFRSLRSSSSGNCLLLWSDHTTILIDCGLATQRSCHQLLDGFATQLDAVIISHAHTDHISYSALCVLGRYGTPVHLHEEVIDQVRGYQAAECKCPPPLRTFADAPFHIGDFEITGVRLPHDPDFPTFGFSIQCGIGAGRRKAILCTDFHDPRPILPHLPGADLVFVEANHDPELLRMHWNPASLFHLSNPKTGELLSAASRAGGFNPRVVMLGHLSRQRNTEDLALETVKSAFRDRHVPFASRIEVAPRCAVSRAVTIE